MRHSKHRYQLGVKKEHREALLANLASALILHEQIETTLTKAKALRPFVEKIVTLAKKAANTDDPARKLHYRRLAYARVRNKQAVNELFEEKVQEFLKREGGYIRILKIGQRIGDAAEMALVELLQASDEGYKKNRRKKADKKAKAKEEPKAEEQAAAAAAVDAEAAPAEDAPKAAAAEQTPAAEEAKEEDKDKS